MHQITQYITAAALLIALALSPAISGADSHVEQQDCEAICGLPDSSPEPAKASRKALAYTAYPGEAVYKSKGEHPAVGQIKEADRILHSTIQTE